VDVLKAAILNDLTKCVGCGACVQACQEINDLPSEPDPKRLSADVYTMVRHEGRVNVRQHCMHCLEPTCASVCPVGALQKTDIGAVIYEEDRCIGCRYCMLACPFDIPKYEWDVALPRIQKCIMCYDKRLAKGEPPACTSVCPTGATLFGDRDSLIDEARERIARHPDRYVNHIYGEHEAGGTSVLYLSPVPFAALGFKTGVQEEPYPKLTWNVLTKIPNIVTVGGVALMGVYWLINRRMTIERLQAAEAETTPSVPDEGGDER
jgi:formate dehydrogenase iron-sulfur subunit